MLFYPAVNNVVNPGVPAGPDKSLHTLHSNAVVERPILNQSRRCLISALIFKVSDAPSTGSIAAIISQTILSFGMKWMKTRNVTAEKQELKKTVRRRPGKKYSGSGDRGRPVVSGLPRGFNEKM
ncbi:MAG: hypothetical protein ABFC78_07655 [Methanoregula sp.]